MENRLWILKQKLVNEKNRAISQKNRTVPFQLIDPFILFRFMHFKYLREKRDFSATLNVCWKECECINILCKCQRLSCYRNGENRLWILQQKKLVNEQNRASFPKDEGGPFQLINRSLLFRYSCVNNSAKREFSGFLSVCCKECKYLNILCKCQS